MNDDPFGPVEIDIERMEKALAGPRFIIPNGLTRQQVKEFITAVGKAYKAGLEDGRRENTKATQGTVPQEGPGV